MTSRDRRSLSKPGWIAGLGALVLLLSALPADLARAQGDDPVEPAPSPEPDRADLIAAAIELEARIVKVLADMDAEILQQEEAAALSGSMEALEQIDALQDRRDALAKQLAEVRAMIAALREDA